MTQHSSSSYPLLFAGHSEMTPPSSKVASLASLPEHVTRLTRLSEHPLQLLPFTLDGCVQGFNGRALPHLEGQQEGIQEDPVTHQLRITCRPAHQMMTQLPKCSIRAKLMMLHDAGCFFAVEGHATQL